TRRVGSRLCSHVLCRFIVSCLPYSELSVCGAVRRPPPPTLFPYTTLFRSLPVHYLASLAPPPPSGCSPTPLTAPWGSPMSTRWRSEEHTSELQSRENRVCRLLLEQKK